MSKIVDVAPQEKRPSWTATIIAIPVGGQITTHYNKLQTVSSVISGRIKMMYPDLKFKLEQAEDKKYLNIKRIA
ncbi:MAG: hypothetical protein K0S09_60 [Sphingobacteriaceae bacterium]|jgi:hypothetical protein|nr:hypothetical protein [Sphingobacteriaceae bacterium]